MQTDPIGYADGLNWYAYVGNDPVNKVDPLGLCSSIIGHAEHGMPFEVSNAPCGSNQFDENSFDCGDGGCRGLFSLGAGSPFGGGGGGGGGAPSRPGGGRKMGKVAISDFWILLIVSAKQVTNLTRSATKV